MNLLKWFDPTNKEHIGAYYHLGHYGVWPEGFIPEDTEFPHMWQVLLAQKLADNWVKYMMKKPSVSFEASGFQRQSYKSE